MKSRIHKNLLLAVAAGLAVFGLVWRGLGMWPLDVHLRDDAYYYFVWAESLAAGAGPCVTPGVPTSGVHILWGLVLAAVSLLGDLPTCSVWLGLALHLATAVVIARIAGTERWHGCLAGSLYLGSHFSTQEAMNGQETAIACLALASFLLGYRRSVWAFFLLGTLAVAARSDLVFLVAALAVSESGLRRARLSATAAVLVCYAAWNLLLAGHWLQDSAEPIPWLMAEEFQAEGTPLLERWQPHLLGMLQFIPFRNSSTPFAIALVAVAIMAIRRRALEFPALLLGGLALVAFHDLWREYPRDYYFAPLGVLGACALIRLCSWSPRVGLVVAVLGCLWNGKHLLDAPPTRNWQREMSMAGRFLDRFVSSDESIGCFNSGIVTWQRAAGRVVNLDGVVNSEAFAALRQGSLLQYLAAAKVRYLLDNEVQFAARGVHSNGRYFGPGFDAASDLVEVARFLWPGDRTPRRSGTEGFRLYRLRSSAPGILAATVATDLGPAPGGQDRLVLWPGRRGQILRIGTDTLVSADADCAYVLQVPWDGRESLRLFVDGLERPVLTIAPE